MGGGAFVFYVIVRYHLMHFDRRCEMCIVFQIDEHSSQAKTRLGRSGGL